MTCYDASLKSGETSCADHQSSDLKGVLNSETY
jgi:hypothetical protein